VIPNIEPAGCTSDEDEADLAARDPNEEISNPDGPSLSGERHLEIYFESIDELYHWNGEMWVLWNY
jgi:hypothetical protein